MGLFQDQFHRTLGASVCPALAGAVFSEAAGKVGSDTHIEGTVGTVENINMPHLRVVL